MLAVNHPMYMEVMVKVTGKMGQCMVGSNYFGYTGFVSLNSWNTISTSTSKINMGLYHQEKLRENLKRFERDHLSITNVYLFKKCIETPIKFFLPSLSSHLKDPDEECKEY